MRFSCAMICAATLAAAACGGNGGGAHVDTAAPAIQARPGALSASEGYVLALDDDGQVFGWGGYSRNDGAHEIAKLPRRLLDGSGYRRVFAGERAIYAIDPEWHLKRLDITAASAEPATPAEPFPGREWSLAIERWGAGLGVARDGTLYWWKEDDVARLLQGSDSAEAAEGAKPKPLMKGYAFVDACLQGVRVYAVSSDGRLFRSAPLMRTMTEDVPLQGERWELDELTVGAPLARVYCRENASHVLALDAQGRVWGAGRNYFGELGVGEPDPHGDRARDDTRLELVSSEPFVDLVVAPQVTLALARDGSLWGWGKNSDDELGLGDDRSRYAPTLIDRSRRYVAIAATYGVGVAVDADGRAWAWGRNALGAFGDGGVAATHDRPAAVLGDTRFGGG